MHTPLSPAQVANLCLSVDEITMTVRAALCLKRLGIEDLGQLVQIIPKVAIRTGEIGRTSINELHRLLEPLGLSMGMELPPELAAQFPLPQGIVLR